MTFDEVFKGPFKADECCCYIWCNDGTQVCFDVMDERDQKLGKRIEDCLNDVWGCEHFNDIGISDDGQYICNGHTPLLCVRGWGHLTGTGGLNLSGEEARQIQDEFVKWAADMLSGWIPDRIPIAQMQLDEMKERVTFYEELLRYLRDNVGTITEDMLECVTDNDGNRFIGYINGKRDKSHNGHPIIRYDIEGEKHIAEWYEDWKYGVTQWSEGEYGDSFHGYILLLTSDEDKFFCFWYSC